MRFGYLYTKELRLGPVFTKRGGMARVDCLQVCTVLVLQSYTEGTFSFLCFHSDAVWPFQHVFMSEVPIRGQLAYIVMAYIAMPNRG